MIKEKFELLDVHFQVTRHNVTMTNIVRPLATPEIDSSRRKMEVVIALAQQGINEKFEMFNIQFRGRPT
jgi:hypothetical protein